jgi:hypothetical protein
VRYGHYFPFRGKSYGAKKKRFRIKKGFFKMTGHIIDGIAVLFGAYLIFTYKWQAKSYIDWQKRNFKRQIKDWELPFGRVANVVVGAIFIVAGILGIVGVL